MEGRMSRSRVKNHRWNLWTLIQTKPRRTDTLNLASGLLKQIDRRWTKNREEIEVEDSRRAGERLGARRTKTRPAGDGTDPGPPARTSGKTAVAQGSTFRITREQRTKKGTQEAQLLGRRRSSCWGDGERESESRPSPAAPNPSSRKEKPLPAAWLREEDESTERKSTAAARCTCGRNRLERKETTALQERGQP
jgi:hypothetical protein